MRAEGGGDAGKEKVFCINKTVIAASVSTHLDSSHHSSVNSRDEMDNQRSGPHPPSRATDSVRWHESIRRACRVLAVAKTYGFVLLQIDLHETVLLVSPLHDHISPWSSSHSARNSVRRRSLPRLRVRRAATAI